MRYEQIIKSIEQMVWAIHQPKLEEIIGLVEARSHGMTPESALGADRWAALEARRTAHLGRKRSTIHILHAVIVSTRHSPTSDEQSSWRTEQHYPANSSGAT